MFYKHLTQTFDTKIEQLKRIDENVSTKIEDEKELETEIVEADDYLDELMEKRYRIQFLLIPVKPLHIVITMC